MTFLSTIPLYGLVHKVDVIRKSDADDGAGGVIPGGVTTVIKDDWQCRVTVMKDEDEAEQFGEATGHHWRVIGKYEPRIQRSDFLRIPWGTQPNLDPMQGLAAIDTPVPGNGFSPQIIVDTPAGDQTLEWNGTHYVDSSGDYVLAWTGTVWRFTDAVAAFSYDFATTYAEDAPVARLDWSTISALNSAGYTYATPTGPNVEYRVTYVKQQLDHIGGMHHTSLMVELEDVDA